ncbi:MAG TPA: hypothetical protein VMU93_10200, partial [Caulobacteraceae bacterium]|nr:hypothetical protein [Caulobacteraceae bacterium]
MARIDAAVDGGREDNAATLLKPDEAVAPGGIVGGEVGAGDGDQAATLGEARQRRGDMAQGGVGDLAVHMRRGREGRIHQHDARSDAGVEVIVDMRGVIAGDGRAGKERSEQPRTGLGELVEDERCPGELGEDSDQARPGRGLQHEIGKVDRGGDAGGEAEGDRCRELLKRLALLGTARLRRQKSGDLAEHGELGGRC